MYIKKYIQFFGILSALLFTTACGGEDIPSGGEGGGTGDGGSSTPVRTITTHINEFQVEGENSSLPGEGEIKELQACLFEDGAMTEIYTQFTQKDGQYTPTRAGVVA